MASHLPRDWDDPAPTSAPRGFDSPRRRYRANALRVLCLDLARHAGAAYPTAAMAMADVAEVLWGSYLRHNPANPNWADRDRFVLSDGHSSPLLYGLLHLTGYELPMAALRHFGKADSMAPLLPTLGATPGVEVTAGPAGQGLANAVGMALAQRQLAARFNRGGAPIIDHFTYALLGQGCLMEGVSHEACSLAGTLGIGKLIALHGDVDTTAETPSSALFSERAPERFKSYGWHVLEGVNGHDPEAIRCALEDARGSIDQPSLICFRVAGRKTDAPTSETRVASLRKSLGWSDAPMAVPEEPYALWDARKNGADMEAVWERRLAAYSRAFPKLATEFRQRMRGELPTLWAETAGAFIADTAATQTSMATRQGSYNALNRYASVLPELLGGSADLTPATKTCWKGSTAVRRERPDGNHVNYGARELAMTAVMTGIARHGGFIPFGGTFLMFCEYARYAMQLAVANRTGSIFVFTHDSIGLGEDGPTHQPIEQLTLLRLIPGMVVWRPCDALECAVAWRDAIERRDGPTCLVFTRQTVPLPSRDPGSEAAVRRGGYVLRDCAGEPELILVATGSEVPLATLAAETLEKRGHRARAVSMPCTQMFESQDSAYRESVLPARVRARLVLEAGVTPLWWKYAGPGGRILGIDRFGESAPQEVLFDYFGFTVEAIVAAAEALLESSPS